MNFSRFIKRLVNCGLVSSTLILSPLPTLPFNIPEARAASPIAIGEVAWAGSALSDADEWLEIWNLGDQNISLAGYALTGANKQPIYFPDDAALPAQGAYLVANYASDNEKSTLAVEPQLVTSTLSLSNTALRLALLDPNGVEIDVAGDGAAPLAGHSGDIKASMFRNGDAWATSTASFNFDPAASESGTPGLVDYFLPAPKNSEPLPVEVVLPVEEPPVESASSTVESVPSSEPQAPYNLVRLNELMPDPDGESEWIEVATLDPSIAVSLDGMQIHDAVGKIYTFTTGTLDVATPFVRVSLTSARLNNGGDTVSLRDPAGNLVDEFVYADSEKNQTWSRYPDITGDWSLTEATPDAANLPPGTIVEVTPEVIVAEEVAVSSTANVSEVAASTSTEQTSNESQPRFDLVKLNEIMANPDGESEWIEVVTLDSNIAVPLDGLQIHDAVGKIYTFSTGTLDVATPFARVFLSSARLNNGGDTVSLRDSNGNLLDELIYDGSEKNQSWSRYPDKTGSWSLTEATPDASNLPAGTVTEVVPEVAATSTAIVAETTTSTVVAETATPAPTSSSSPVVPASSSTPTVPAASTAPVTTTVPSAPSSSSVPVVPVAPSTATVATPKATTVKTPAAPNTTTAETKKIGTTSTATKSTTTKTTTPKTTTAKTTTVKTSAAQNLPIPITMDMTHVEDNAGIRVSLTGIIGSQPGLMTGHRFILLSPEGRGLLIKVPTALKLPDAGQTIEVTGKLSFDDLGAPSLSFGKTDGWQKTENQNSTVALRNVNLAAPSMEDAWSLVSTQGTVVSVRTSTFTLALNSGEIDVAIRKVVDYRTSRISVGDVMQITGLLDMSQDVPRIIPRSADEITLIKHAEIVQPAATKPTLPGWTPFGAAGLAVAGTEGVKRFRLFRRRRNLEKVLETDINGKV
jgi:hypothetical protein